MSKLTSLSEILPELFAGSPIAPLLPTEAIAPDLLALCHWVQGINPDTLTYPTLLTPGVWLKSAQAVVRLQVEAQWAIAYSKGELPRFPARVATGALEKDLKSLKELICKP